MKKQETPSRKTVIASILCLLAAIYMIYHVARSLRQNAELFTVTPYVSEETSLLHGVFFTDEAVLTADHDGVPLFYFENGDKVAANTKLCDIYPMGSESTVDQMQALFARASRLGESALAFGDTKESIQKEIDRLAASHASGAVGVSSYERRLRILTAKKELLTLGKTDYKAEIASLLAEAEALRLTLGAPIATLVTERAGYAYIGNDGYGEAFHASAAEEMTVEAYDARLAEKPIPAAHPSVTVITDFRWNYVCKLTQEEASLLRAGAIYTCRFSDSPDAAPFKAELTEIRTDGKGDALLLLTATVFPKDIEPSRFQGLTLLRSRTEGYRVPKEAVTEIDGTSYVFIFYDGAARLREISILGEQNGYHLVSSDYESKSGKPVLRINDLVLVDADGLYDGKPID